jgi:hypothetical protein
MREDEPAERPKIHRPSAGRAVPPAVVDDDAGCCQGAQSLDPSKPRTGRGRIGRSSHELAYWTGQAGTPIATCTTTVPTCRRGMATLRWSRESGEIVVITYRSVLRRPTTREVGAALTTGSPRGFGIVGMMSQRTLRKSAYSPRGNCCSSVGPSTDRVARALARTQALAGRGRATNRSTGG